jgi:ubiquinol-cytochrome c reductase cytochrome c subunit
VRLLSARLSAKRRSPLAGLVVLLMGLLVTGGLYAALSPATADTSEADQSTVEQGRALFLVGCASCHGKNGEGIVTKRGTQYGPPLAGVGAAAVDFQVGTGRMPMARPGVQAQRKKVVYTPEEISALAAYVASLGPGPAIPSRSEYDATGADDKSIVRGGQFFKTNCTACHNFAASGGALPGGKFAPGLKGVTDKHIYEAMLTGPQQMPVFSNGVVTPDEKRDIIAYLNSIENDPGYGGISLGALGPVSEGLTAWLVGIGACVAFAIWIASSSVRSKKGIKS